MKIFEMIILNLLHKKGGDYNLTNVIIFQHCLNTKFVRNDDYIENVKKYCICCFRIIKSSIQINAMGHSILYIPPCYLHKFLF